MSYNELQSHYSLVIIGAGPAGLSAAAVAAEHGIDVALLDEQASPGGQIYRAMESVPTDRADLLGAEYQRGEEHGFDEHFFPFAKTFQARHNLAWRGDVQHSTLIHWLY